MLFLRSVGLDARIVHNQEDHVWNEYYSRSAQRWVHLDSCEAAFDTPLMYELGWGRKMSYVLAFGLEGAQDVSRGYVADYHEHGWERRRKWNDQDLAEVSLGMYRIGVCFADWIAIIIGTHSYHSWKARNPSRNTADRIGRARCETRDLDGRPRRPTSGSSGIRRYSQGSSKRDQGVESHESRVRSGRWKAVCDRHFS
jgi:hypothetical protein